MIDNCQTLCEDFAHADSNPAIPKTLYRFSPALTRKGYASFHPGSIARFETQAKSFMKRNDFAGKTFGRLKVIECVGKDKFNNALWLCRCLCGSEHTTSSLGLRSGHCRSCGCLQRELQSQRATVHGMAKIPEYNTWGHIKRRCLNPNEPQWKDYGGRGIKVCQEWMDSFESFYKHVGPRPSVHHSIDRINNNGNYEPGNVRWATRTQQANNTRSNHVLAFNGTTKTLSEWARELNMPVSVINDRLKGGWLVSDALTTPILDGQRDRRNPRLCTHKNLKMITFNGESKPLFEWAKQLNISQQALGCRINRHGWAIDRAMTTPAAKANIPITFRGVTKTMKQWATARGLTYDAVCLRLSSGWSVEDTLTRPLRITKRTRL